MTPHVTSGWDVLNSLITTVPTILGAVGVLWVAISQHTQAKLQQTQGEVLQEVKVQTNGLTEKLVASGTKEGHQQGMVDQRAADAEQRLEEIRGHS
jgi:hypothetical protein